MKCSRCGRTTTDAVRCVVRVSCNVGDQDRSMDRSLVLCGSCGEGLVASYRKVCADVNRYFDRVGDGQPNLGE